MRKMFERSKETDKLVALFQEMSIDNPLSFDNAGKVVGFPVKSTSSAYHSARRIAANEHNIVIEGVRGFGFVRLTSIGIVDRGGKHLKSIKRRARRASGEMEIAISGNLDRDHMLRATEQLSRMRIISDTSSPVRAASNKSTAPEPAPAEGRDNRAALRAI